MTLRRVAIIFEDEALLVVDKPAGMLTVPAPHQEKKDLTALLTEHLRTEASPARAYPCHRLDRETSGIVIFAKGKAVQKIMMEHFRCRRVQKRYIAFVHGAWRVPGTRIKSYIQKGWPYEQGAPRQLAITDVRSLAVTEHVSVLALRPVTGRNNQLRIQLRDAGHPIIGDRRFSIARSWPLRFKRTALHAYAVSFPHPHRRTPVSLESPLPADMRRFIEDRSIHIDPSAL